jgi:hypothetical protein
LKVGYGLTDTGETNLAAEDNQGFKQRRRVLASAHGNPDRLEHGPCLESERIGGCAQCLVERIVVEFRCCENLLRELQNAQREGGIAFLGDQLGRVFPAKPEVRPSRKMVEEAG